MKRSMCTTACYTYTVLYSEYYISILSSATIIIIITINRFNYIWGGLAKCLLNFTQWHKRKTWVYWQIQKSSCIPNTTKFQYS